MGVIFILIKPDGVEAGLVGEIIPRFERKGFTLKGLEMITVDRPFAEKHYHHLSANPLFSYLVDYIISAPVVAMIWEGVNVVLIGRNIIEKTSPTASDTEPASTLIHVSDSVESAYKEAALWFPDTPVTGPDAATPNARHIGRISFDTMEQTLILIKPDGVQTGLVGKIIRRFDRKGFTLKGLKMITVDRPFAEKHYQDSSAKPFFPHLVNYISSGPVVAMIWEGKNVVSTGRKIIGKTIPCNDMDTDIGSTLFHGSDSVESAYKETALWFPEGPVKLHSDVARPKARDIGRISITGFDTGIPHENVESTLREHFASCGKITDVYIRKGSSVAYIYFVGEGAVDKALELSGSNVGGWKVCAEADPFWDNNGTLFTVQGYDPSLLDSEIESGLRDHFSSCGVVREVTIFKRASVVRIKGFDAVDKALELSGSKLGKRKLVVRCLSRPPRYTVHDRRGPPLDPRTRFQGRGRTGDSRA